MAEKQKARKEKKGFASSIGLPKGVAASMKEGILSLKGPKGESSLPINMRKFSVVVGDGSIDIDPQGKTQRHKMHAGSLEANIRNLVEGVQRPYTYTLKICSGHFPMNVALSGDKFSVKNFFGEKVARVLLIKKGAAVKVEGDRITVQGVSKDVVGQVSADIEQLMRRANFDTRIFQDGIYIISKGEKGDA